MEENNNIDSQNTAVEEEVQPVQEAQSQPVPPMAASDSSENEIKVQVKKTVRKNGRNNATKRTSQVSSASAATCGEIEDLSNFKEKLSGSNVEGYGEDESSENRKNSRERGEKRQRKPRYEEKPSAEGNTSDAENSANPEESKEEKPARNGPSFETDKKFAPRAIEVGLTDHRSPFSNESKAKEGVVSYSPEDCKCPSISLWMRIKEAVASIFGKKPAKKRKNKFNGDKNWKGREDRKFGNKKGDWKKGGHRKNGGNKRRYNDRRPGGSKPSKGGGENSAS